MKVFDLSMRRFINTVSVILVILCVVVMLAVMLARLMATPFSEAEPANVIVALGGDSGARSAKALELYRARIASNIVLSSIDIPLNSQQRYSSLDWRGDYLSERGVPASVITYLTLPTNTWTEAKALLHLMTSKGWKSAVVVSDPPHMRRLAWIFGTLNTDCVNVRIQVVRSDPSWWVVREWWGLWHSTRFVFLEFSKNIYYRWEYSSEANTILETCKASLSLVGDVSHPDPISN